MTLIYYAVSLLHTSRKLYPLSSGPISNASPVYSAKCSSMTLIHSDFYSSTTKEIFMFMLLSVISQSECFYDNENR